MRIGLYVSQAGESGVEPWLRRCERAEAAGFHTAWAGQVFAHDALTLMALAALRTRRIELGTWVLPIQPRHPAVLAQQALTVQAAAGGRLLLGLGVSHPEVIEKRLGLPWSAPARHMREFLDVLRPLLRGEHVEHAGERFRISLALDSLGAPPPPVFVAALGPAMLRLAGERADGVAIWLGGERYLEGFALPRIRAGARAAGRSLPRVACGLPVAVADPARARAAAEVILARSAKLPAYRRVLEHSGAASPGEVVIAGDEAAVAARLDRLAALGVTDFNAVLFSIEGDAEVRERTWRFLAARTRA